MGASRLRTLRNCSYVANPMPPAATPTPADDAPIPTIAAAMPPAATPTRAIPPPMVPAAAPIPDAVAPIPPTATAGSTPAAAALLPPSLPLAPPPAAVPTSARSVPLSRGAIWKVAPLRSCFGMNGARIEIKTRRDAAHVHAGDDAEAHLYDRMAMFSMLDRLDRDSLLSVLKSREVQTGMPGGILVWISNRNSGVRCREIRGAAGD